MNHTASNLPRPTDDPDRVRHDIDAFGYGLLRDAVPEPLLGQALMRIEEQARAELEAGLAFEDGGPTQQWGQFLDEHGQVRAEAFTAANGGINQRVWMLPNKGQVFRDVLEHDPLHEPVSHVLGDEYQLSSFSANIAKPGGVKMNLHTDQWWAPEPTRRDRRSLPVGSMTRSRFDHDAGAPDPSPMLAPAACANVIVMMNAFSDANGGTRVVPGSHLAGRHPDPERDRDVETVPAEGDAGTALFTDGRVWHGTGENRTDAHRVGMLITFCGPQYRPQTNFAIGMDRDVLSRCSDRLKALFGLKVWWGYGRTGNPTVQFIDPEARGLGEMRPAVSE